VKNEEKYSFFEDLKGIQPIFMSVIGMISSFCLWTLVIPNVESGGVSPTIKTI
jgi:hypothetical protein